MMFKFFNVLVLALFLTGCSKTNDFITFQINGISTLELPVDLLNKAQITPLDDFLILLSSTDSIHINSLVSADLNQKDVDMREFPRYLFGLNSNYPNSDYGKELKAAYKLHSSAYSSNNNKIETKDLLRLYISNSENTATIYVAHQEISDQITAVTLKSNDIQNLIDIAIKGIYYDEPK